MKDASWMKMKGLEYSYHRISLDCPTYQDFRIQTWPEELQPQEKLLGLATGAGRQTSFLGVDGWFEIGSRRRTADFILRTGWMV